jgi:hypothetical protein
MSAKPKEARLNVQGLARKDLGLLGCILPDPGWVTVSIDFAAGEPSVTSHFSQDKNYMYACFDGVGKEPFYQNNVLMIDDIYLMSCSISPVGAAKMRDAFNRKWPAGSFQDQWAHDSEVVKKELKKDRQLHKILCMAEGTLVRVRGRGFTPIELVTNNDLIWDGSSWVSCDGSVFTGVQKVISVFGDLCTQDHQVLTKNGWQQAKEVRDRGVRKEDLERLSRPSGTWTEVWSVGCRIVRSPATWQVPVYLCRLWARAGVEKLRQFKVRKVHEGPRRPD